MTNKEQETPERTNVFLLYSLYPCASWEENKHSATPDCKCWDCLEGVFSTPAKAKEYIGQWLDENHANLSWKVWDANRHNRHSFSQIIICEDPDGEYPRLVYHIHEMPLYD